MLVINVVRPVFSLWFFISNKKCVILYKLCVREDINWEGTYYKELSIKNGAYLRMALNRRWALNLENFLYNFTVFSL